MAVGHRHAQALCGDVGLCRIDDFAVFDMAPEFQRLLLGLFLFAADVWDYIIEHFRPCFKRLAGTGNCLIGTNQRLFYAVFHQRVQCWYIALQAAIRFDGNKTSLGTKPSALCVNDTDMVGVDLRYDHRNIRRVAMGRIVGHDRAFKLCVPLLKCLNLVFFHVDGTEHKINLLRNLFRICLCIHYDHGFDAFGNGIGHMPLFTKRLRVGLACTVCAGSQNNRGKPRMICCQQHKPLPDHTRCANNTDSEFLHDENSHPQTHRKVPVACHFGM